MTGEALALAIQLTVVGMSIVFIALWLLIALLGVMKPLDRWLSKSAAKEDAVGMPVPSVAPGVGADLAPEVMAAISAAVMVATMRRVRITRMRYLGTPPEATWSRQGRLTIMASHRPKG